MDAVFNKITKKSQTPRDRPLIPASLEARAGGLQVQVQPGQVSKILSQKIKTARDAGHPQFNNLLLHAVGGGGSKTKKKKLQEMIQLILEMGEFYM